VVTGWGTINGRMVYVFSQDFTVLGGSVSETHAEKICKIMDMAMQNGAPVIGINDSGGARIQEGVDSLPPMARCSSATSRPRAWCRRSASSWGPARAARSIRPAMTDFIFMVKDSSYMFVTGPDVVKTVTNEQVTAEELGGASTHTRNPPSPTGLRERCRGAGRGAPAGRFPAAVNREKPPGAALLRRSRADRESLDTLVPDNPNQPYDMKELILKVADEGDFFEIQPDFAKNIITGFIRLEGRPWAWWPTSRWCWPACSTSTAPQGGALRAVLRLLRDPDPDLRRRARLPARHAQEYNGVIKHGAKLLFAYGEATVPKVTVITRKAYGGAYVVMSSKHLRGDINYAWPTSEIAVMGAKGAVEILHRADLGDPEKIAARTKDYEDRFANPFVAAERGFIDEVIQPRSTRRRVCRAFAALRRKKKKMPWKKHDNAPRPHDHRCDRARGRRAGGDRLRRAAPGERRGAMKWLRGLPLSPIGWIALLAALGSAVLAVVALRLPTVPDAPNAAERLAAVDASLCSQDERFTLPSGRLARLCELVVEPQPFASEDWLIVRILAPDLEVTGERDGHFDHDWACEAIGLPNAAPETARIVVQLMADAFPRGEPAPGITQSIEAYSIEDETCIWELF
jgi:propionyl-CoA carboxylase beta chain